MTIGIKRYVFYADQLYGEYPFDAWRPAVMGIPDGAYVLYTETNNVYLYQFNSLIPLNNCDIPAEIKTLCLLLGINL